MKILSSAIVFIVSPVRGLKGKNHDIERLSMPVKKGVGWNPHCTPHKQYSLNRLAGHLIGSVAACAPKFRAGSAIVFDMTCGPGYNDGEPGSPLILAKHVSHLTDAGFPCRLVCVDCRSEHLSNLQIAMHKEYPGLPVDYAQSQYEALANLPPNTVGLAYFDHTEYTGLDINLLHCMGQQFHSIDILFTRSCLDAYRMSRAAHTADMTLWIQEYLAATGKKCQYVGQYAKYRWWSFGFADNWENRPPKKLRWHEGPRGKLVRVDTPEGQNLLKHLMKEEEESLWTQPMLSTLFK